MWWIWQPPHPPYFVMSLGTSATQNTCLGASETKGYWRRTMVSTLLGTSLYLITHSDLLHITTAIHAPTHLSSWSFTNCHWLSAPCCSTCRLQWWLSLTLGVGSLWGFTCKASFSEGNKVSIRFFCLFVELIGLHYQHPYLSTLYFERKGYSRLQASYICRRFTCGSLADMQYKLMQPPSCK